MSTRMYCDRCGRQIDVQIKVKFEGAVEDMNDIDQYKVRKMDYCHSCAKKVYDYLTTPASATVKEVAKPTATVKANVVSNDKDEKVMSVSKRHKEFIKSEVRRMLDEGIKQVTISNELNVSPSKVCGLAKEYAEEKRRINANV